MRRGLPAVVALSVVVAAWCSAWPPAARAQDRRLGRTDGAERRVALVIGNDTYAGAALSNAVNDARTVTSALRQLNFAVETTENASAEALARAIDGFVGRVQPGDVAIFYYSGHGVQVDGVNYLIPIDFTGGDAVALKFRTVSVSEIDERLERRGARVRILILDACRDNPFRGTRSGSGGLAAYTAEGALIAYATGAGATASDNAGAANGLFTSYFVDALKKPGITATELFRWVRLQVREKSGGRQVPWLHDGLVGEFVFNAGAAVPAPTPPPPAARPNPPASAPRLRAPVVAFTTPAGAMLFPVKPDQTAAFDALVRTIDTTLASAADPIARQQHGGLRFFKCTDMYGTNALYVAIADPAVSGAEYEPTRIVTAAAGIAWDSLPRSTQDVIRTGIAAAESISRLSLTPILMASKASVTPVPAAGTPRLGFTGDAGMLLVQIKPDQVQTFEAFVARLARGLRTTIDPVLARQASGYSIYRADEPYSGNALYAVVANPVVPNADYDLFSMMQKALRPDELSAPSMADTWKQWQNAFAGINKLNLIGVSSGARPQASRTNPLHVGGTIAPPAKLKHVEPEYPKVAISARIQGVVTVEATIDVNGKVTDAKILNSVPLLDQAALDAVRQWEFAVTRLNGVPVPVIMTVTVNFSLR
jgi:TonB family protein